MWLLTVLVCPSYSCLQAPEKVGLGVLDLAKTAASSGAEVPIPVLMDVSNTASSQPTGQDPVPPELPPKPSVPVISITKPPAPLPVDLPTHDDIVPTTLDFDSHPDDIESSGSLMREISHPRTPTEFSNPGPQRESPSAPSPTQTPLSGDTTPPPSAPSTSLSGVPDLLGDPAPTLVASPIQPSPTAGPSTRATSPPLLLPVESTPINSVESDQEGEESLASTIRLVGNGGEVGLALDQTQSDEASDPHPQAETAPRTAFTSKEIPLHSHGKRASVRGLREGKRGN